jgi:predicted enzyme related to lactoylglutathione lyase
LDAEISETGTYQPFAAGGQMIGGMFTKHRTIPAPFWLYYFNTGDIDATAQRVKAGGGHILEGPTESPAGSWIIRCTDPQGAVFALEGTRRGRPVGYFARAASRGSSGAPSRR